MSIFFYSLGYVVNKMTFVVLGCFKFQELSFFLCVMTIIIFIGQANQEGRKAWNHSITQKDFLKSPNKLGQFRHPL